MSCQVGPSLFVLCQRGISGPWWIPNWSVRMLGPRFPPLRSGEESSWHFCESQASPSLSAVRNPGLMSPAAVFSTFSVTLAQGPAWLLQGPDLCCKAMLHAGHRTGRMPLSLCQHDWSWTGRIMAPGSNLSTVLLNQSKKTKKKKTCKHFNWQEVDSWGIWQGCQSHRKMALFADAFPPNYKAIQITQLVSHEFHHLLLEYFSSYIVANIIFLRNRSTRGNESQPLYSLISDQLFSMYFKCNIILLMNAKYVWMFFLTTLPFPNISH